MDDIIDPDTGTEHRRRGRPRLPPDEKRREKLTLSLTAEELRLVRIAAANDGRSAQDWARHILAQASQPGNTPAV